MFIQCEKCRAKFKIPDPAQISPETKFRCSRCKHVFSLKPNNLPQPAATELPERISVSSAIPPLPNEILPSISKPVATSTTRLPPIPTPRPPAGPVRETFAAKDSGGLSLEFSELPDLDNPADTFRPPPEPPVLSSASPEDLDIFRADTRKGLGVQPQSSSRPTRTSFPSSIKDKASSSLPATPDLSGKDDDLGMDFDIPVNPDWANPDRERPATTGLQPHSPGIGASSLGAFQDEFEPPSALSAPPAVAPIDGLEFNLDADKQPSSALNPLGSDPADLPNDFFGNLDNTELPPGPAAAPPGPPRISPLDPEPGVENPSSIQIQPLSLSLSAQDLFGSSAPVPADRKEDSGAFSDDPFSAATVSGSHPGLVGPDDNPFGTLDDPGADGPGGNSHVSGLELDDSNFSIDKSSIPNPTTKRPAAGHGSASGNAPRPVSRPALAARSLPRPPVVLWTTRDQRSVRAYQIGLGLLMLSIFAFAFVVIRSGGQPDLTRWATYTQAFSVSGSTPSQVSPLGIARLATTTYKNVHGHGLLLFWGEIENRSDQEESVGGVQGDLLGSNGQVLVSMVVPAGVSFSPAEVFEMADPSGILSSYANKGGPQGTTLQKLAAGARLPFMGVMFDHPPVTAEMQLRVNPVSKVPQLPTLEPTASPPTEKAPAPQVEPVDPKPIDPKKTPATERKPALKSGKGFK